MDIELLMGHLLQSCHKIDASGDISVIFPLAIFTMCEMEAIPNIEQYAMLLIVFTSDGFSEATVTI